MNFKETEGFSAILLLLVMGTVLLIVAGARYAMSQKYLKNSLQHVDQMERFYAGETAALTAFFQDASGGTRPQLSFTNSYAPLIGKPSSNSNGKCRTGGCALPFTAQLDNGTSLISHTKNLVVNIKQLGTERLFCGMSDTIISARVAPNQVCLKKENCSQSSLLSCYSSEAVEQLYRALLGREPGPGESQYWVAEVASGNLSIQEVEGRIRSSSEYFNRSPIDCQNRRGSSYTYSLSQRKRGAELAEDVTALYRSYLGRFPDPNGLTAYVRQLLGCPTPRNPVVPRPIDFVVNDFERAFEFNDPNGNQSRLHAEPIRELYLMMLGRDPAVDTSAFAKDLAGIEYWMSRLTGQNTPIHTTISLNTPPFIYGGGPLSTLWTQAPSRIARSAMFFNEVQSNPAGGRPVGTGIAESPEYIGNESGLGENITALFRTILKRLPGGGNPRDEIAFYSKMMQQPYNASLQTVASYIRGSAEFTSQGSPGCGCTAPAPQCTFEFPEKAVSGQNVDIQLHVLANVELDASQRVKSMGSPDPLWDPTTKPGSVRSVFWNSNQPIQKGMGSYSRTIVAGITGSTLSGTATVSGPGGSNSCSYSIPVVSPKQSCTIYVERRGPGMGSQWNFGGAGDISTARGPYSVGGGDRPHSFYYSWRVWIPGEASTQFQFTTDAFRSGSGYQYVGSQPPTASGNHDPCNRNSAVASCASTPNAISPRPIPATYRYQGVTYQLMTRLSDGTAQDYANGGVCGSKDCKCYLSGVISPLLVNFSDEKIRLNSLTAFDLGEGKRQYFWPSGEQKVAFLALDKNKNSRIDDYSELFGSETEDLKGRKAENGFLALAAHDKNLDKQISENDKVFTQLRLWFDDNANGTVERNELKTLQDYGVLSIDLEYKEFDESLDVYGNVARQHSYVKLQGKRKILIQDVWLAEVPNVVVRTKKLSLKRSK